MKRKETHDRDLELEELLDRVVDTTSPHDGRDDGSKVVVHDDDVGRLLGDLRSSDTHRESDVGSLESGTIDDELVQRQRGGERGMYPSLVPSPVTPTTSPMLLRCSTKIFLSSGDDRARTYTNHRQYHSRG